MEWGPQRLLLAYLKEIQEMRTELDLSLEVTGKSLQDHCAKSPQKCVAATVRAGGGEVTGAGCPDRPHRTAGPVG